MDYEAAVEAFFKPVKAGSPITAVVNAGPARQLRDACEPIAMHAVWSRLVNERLAQLGLNFLSSYVWGRAAALGEPEAAVVASAFAAFDTGLVTSLYQDGRSKLGRDKLLETRNRATIESLTAVLGNADVSFAVETLRRAVEAADPTGRPLFAGLKSQPWPQEGLGQLWRACDLVREHRGDSHIAAYIGAGLSGVAMNMLTELFLGMPLGTYSATRAWSEEDTSRNHRRLESKGLIFRDKLTEQGQQLRQAIEDHTDEMEGPLVEAIGTDMPKLLKQLNEWSEKCIEDGAFPPDEYKRAAG